MISLIAPSPSFTFWTSLVDLDVIFLLFFINVILLNFAINKYDIEKLNAAIIVEFLVIKSIIKTILKETIMPIKICK